MRLPTERWQNTEIAGLGVRTQEVFGDRVDLKTTRACTSSGFSFFQLQEC
jgi:hypothetical protein